MISAGKHSVQKWFSTLNGILDKTMPLLTPVGVSAGYLFPDAFIILKPYVPVLFGFMTLSGALKLRFSQMKETIKNPLPILIFFITAHIIMPGLALLLGSIWNPLDHEITAGFILLFAIPTAVSGFIWNSIFSGHGALSLSLILFDTLLAPFLVPFTVTQLLGTAVHIDSRGMMLSLSGMVVVPTIIGVWLNELSQGRIPARTSPLLGVFSKLFLLLVIAANTSAVAPKVDLFQKSLWIIALQGIFLSLVGFLLGKIAGIVGKCETPVERTLVFSVGLRNISAAATLAIAFFPEKAAVPAILGMIFQQTLAAISGRVLLGSPDNIRQQQDKNLL
ncbi:bile acid:sodium symporter family protein [Gracilinema caldarium]|uniref:bile acid:sodium symporter family protein n=1 Tax=Gracilinema caldarium TaxID=215591 RepID=UPI0026EA1841|nr:bile acid:sodium symporter family protein [Gracilinema caldarium]